jgi:hypothetical protein
MITFKDIINEDRSEQVWEIPPYKAIEKYCKIDQKDLLKRTPIYRATGGSSPAKLIIYNKENLKKTRDSKDNHEFYFTFIRESKYWKGYPKRENSIICTTSKFYMNKFQKNYSLSSYKYQIIPENNTTIAVCPLSDIIYAFGTKIFKNNSPGKNANLKQLDTFLLNYCECEDSDDLNTIKNKINKRFKIYEDSFKDEHKNKFVMTAYNDVFHYVDKYYYNKEKFKSFADCFEYCLSPELNGFELIKYDNNFKIGNKEVWFSNTALGIKL